MKRFSYILPIIFNLLFTVPSNSQSIITFQSLLREIVDREKITEFPTITPYKTLQASSYNRASISPDQPGWFADSDGVFCIRTEKNKNGETEWVLMEDNGPGVITKIWAVCFYYGLNDTIGANLNIYLDGEEKPTIHGNFFDIVKGRSFIAPPLAQETRRAGNLYLPIPYAKSCKVTMDKKVFYNIINYRSYPKGTNIQTFSMDEYMQSKELIDSVNQVLSKGVHSNLHAMTKDSNLYLTKTISPQNRASLTIEETKKAIEQLTFKLEAENLDQALRSTILRISFDEEETVWTPLGDFFNIGVGVKEYHMWERSVEKDGTMICRWIMPFRKKATIELENLGQQNVTAQIKAVTTKYDWTDQSMYFHANWRMDEPTPTFPLFDYNLIKVKGQGIYVGDQFTVLNPKEGWWGEGDEKVYVDNDTFPSHFGTGTEDYYGWAGGVVPNPVDEFYVPFLSNVRVASPNSKGYNTCTRTRVLDAIPFNDSINFNIESSSGTRTSWFHLQYAVNTYWYAKPGAICNQKPLPEMASRKIPTLEELIAFNNNAKKNKYVYPDAIEAENLETYKLDKYSQNIDKMNIWGDLSNGDAKCFQYTQKGASIQVLLTELFNDVPLKICLLTGNECGEIDIYVNDKAIKSVNLKAEHSAVTTIDLGIQKPIKNTININFISKSEGKLGIDYFLIN